jgi:sugar/nucleoside kinase (ribokinase family)
MTMDRPHDGRRDRRTVLVIGAASRDVTPEDPRGWRLGGAVTYVSLMLARLGVEVWSLVGVDSAASTADELSRLEADGAFVTRVALDTGPVFENIETPTGRRQRCLSAATPIALTDLPRAWTSGFDALVIAPVAGELDDTWAMLGDAAMPRAGAPTPLVALGWQGLLRDVVAGRDVERRAPVARPLLTRADLVVVSADDLGPSVPPGSVVPLVRPGATLVITRGERGGSAFSRPVGGGRSALRTYSALAPERVIDPTGAGDVFLGALVATAVDAERLGVSSFWSDRLQFAAAAASLCVEAPGLAGVPDLDAIRRRMTLAPSRASRRPSATSSRTSGRPSQA